LALKRPPSEPIGDKKRVYDGPEKRQADVCGKVKDKGVFVRESPCKGWRRREQGGVVKVSRDLRVTEQELALQ
jgi:hypothetical protein